jgi:uncharacterized damage-inducible protein DinB
MADDPLRSHVIALLTWDDAHVGFEVAVTGVPSSRLGARPEGLPYSLWQLLEHLRLTQLDILEFCRPSPYRHREWPADYWPSSQSPPSPGAWDESVAAFLTDREELRSMAADPEIDLLSVVPNGTTQTYLRELLLVADHTAYHIGQIIVARRTLGAWPAP